MPSATELEAKVERVATAARAAGRVPVDPRTDPGVVLEGMVVAGSVDFVGLFRERGEATAKALAHAPSLLRDIGGSWVVFELKGRRQ